jgi:hypothetical protein
MSTVTLFDPTKPISPQDIEEMAELWSRHNVVIEKSERHWAIKALIMVFKVIIYVAIGAVGLIGAYYVPDYRNIILIGAGILEGMFLLRFIFGYLPPFKIR